MLSNNTVFVSSSKPHSSITSGFLKIFIETNVWDWHCDNSACQAIGNRTLNHWTGQLVLYTRPWTIYLGIILHISMKSCTFSSYFGHFRIEIWQTCFYSSFCNIPNSKDSCCSLVMMPRWPWFQWLGWMVPWRQCPFRISNVPLEKAQWRLCPITFLKHEGRKWFIAHQLMSCPFWIF